MDPMALHDAYTRQLQDGTLPIVDAADLRSLWALSDEHDARYPGGRVAMGVSGYQKILSPGADVHAATMRFGLLRTLKRVNEVECGKVPGFVDGKPDDALYELFAKGNVLLEFRKIMTIVDPRGAGLAAEQAD
jgi:hypothetical protein